MYFTPSPGRGSESLFPQALHIAHQWDTEETFVFPIEVRGVMISYAVGGTCRVKVWSEPIFASQSQPCGCGI